MSNNYRKIYERHYKASLLDGIDIHHIDGNHENNDPLNLRAVTLKEHYDIHKFQNDHYAAYMIASRMKSKPDDWLEMAKINGKKSAEQNMKQGVGLTVWAKNNPVLAKEVQSKAGTIGGKKTVDEKIGIHAFSKEEKQKIASRGGKRSAELGLGFKAGHAAEAGKIGGKKGGVYAKENRTGIFALTPEQNKQRHFNSVVSKLIKNGKASAWPRKEII
jgi:hypothetical protein